MDQQKLFPDRYDSYLEALRDDINALGGPKVVGEWFAREKSPEAQRNWVNDRLNIARRERFTDEQERLIMRRAREKRGYSAAVYCICDETGFERPKAIEPEDERAKAMRDFTQAVEIMSRHVERLERLGVKIPAPLAVVK